MKIFPVSRTALLAGVLVCAALAYCQFFTHGFVLDDHDLLERVIPTMHSPIDAWKTGNAFQSYYRPVFLTSLWIDNALFGEQSWGYHAVNIILHLLAAWCAFLFAERLFRRTAPAAAVALLFALQPAHTENVSWISGRTDILCAIFVFLALSALYDLLIERKRDTAWLTAIYFLLAIGSKETAIVLPALAVLIIMIWKLLPKPEPVNVTAEAPKRRRKPAPQPKRSMKPILLAILLYACVAGAMLILRATVITNSFVENTFTTADLLWLNAARCLAMYIQHGIVGGGYAYLILGWRVVDPMYNLHLPVETMDWVWIWVTIGVFLAALGAAIWWKRGIAVIGVCGFFLFLFPALGFVPIQSIFSVRFLYIPSFFLALAVVDFILAFQSMVKIPKANIVFATALGAVALWWGYETFRQDTLWKSDKTLFLSMSNEAENSPIYHFSIANAYRYLGEYRTAASEFTQAVEIYPAYHDAYINLGGCYMMMGQRDPTEYQQAVSTYQGALKLFPSESLFYMLMGDAYLRLGDHENARLDYSLAYTLDKTSPEVRKRLDMLHIEIPGM